MTVSLKGVSFSCNSEAVSLAQKGSWPSLIDGLLHEMQFPDFGFPMNFLFCLYHESC